MVFIHFLQTTHLLNNIGYGQILMTRSDSAIKRNEDKQQSGASDSYSETHLLVT